MPADSSQLTHETTPTSHWLAPLPGRLAEFVASYDGPTPYVVVDSGVVGELYDQLAEALPGCTLYYAVKANPERRVLQTLVDRGSCFDVASVAEIETCLAAGAHPDAISYGSTIKTRDAIRAAVRLGVWKFSVDCREELDKVLHEAPGAEIGVRLLHDCEGADWPLSRKFGCDAPLATELVSTAAAAGSPVGLSFHVGSQQRDVHAWDAALAACEQVIDAAAQHGAAVSFVNLGGGFPGSYREAAPATAEYGDAIRAAVERRLGGRGVELRAEPGRYLTADAGVLVARVVLVSRRDGRPRWVYLDAGVFSGLFEAMGEAIRYQLVTPAPGALEGAVIAGPTCDSADVLYERCGYQLPAALAEGDPVIALSAGAYTHVYAAQGFNGFPPPECHVL